MFNKLEGGDMNVSSEFIPKSMLMIPTMLYNSPFVNINKDVNTYLIIWNEPVHKLSTGL